jgi:hypothetical protein
MLGMAAAMIAMPACAGDGHLNLLGYTTRPNYDTGIRTVYVPIFENKTMQAGPWRGLERQLTDAIVKQIELKTPYKVVGSRARADTELIGTIVVTNKTLINRNQLNEIREGETAVQVEIFWRDLRTGEVLSRPATKTPPGTPPPPVDPNKPPPVVLVSSFGRFIPELGESVATALKQNCDRMAVQIVSMMERPW